jgi:opine dehydrogenase
MGSAVAVIGAGNVGCALAADLSLRGVDVRLSGRPARLAAIRAQGGIELTGKLEGSAAIPALIADIGQAVRGAEVIAVTVPTPALPDIARALVAAATPEQLIWLDPGHSGGALFLAAEFARHGSSPRPQICQTSTASHGSRLSGPASVGVFALPTVTVASLPASDIGDCLPRIEQLLPGRVGTAPSVLALDLQNINAVMHPPQMITNAGWIESTGGDFFIYRDGSPPAVARLIETVDAERLVLAKRLDVPTLSLVDALAAAGFTTLQAAQTGRVHEAIQRGEPLGAVKSPPSLDHRYLHEDVGWGLVQWIHLGRAVGVPTPAMTAVATVAGALNGVDYIANGVTLERMGLDRIDAERIADFASNGAP